MTTRHMVIHWDGADEYLQFDIETLLNREIETTSEWWQHEQQLLTYNTTSEA